MDATELEAIFPGLSGSEYGITSPRSVNYNCVAWAAGRNDRWWWPDPLGIAVWPEGAARTATIEAFVEAFGRLGYSQGENDALETGVEKVAIFAAADAPMHVARQLPNGKWTSKLGKSVDIEHELHALDGDRYGRVACILRRHISLPSS